MTIPVHPSLTREIRGGCPLNSTGRERRGRGPVGDGGRSHVYPRVLDFHDSFGHTTSKFVKTYLRLNSVSPWSRVKVTSSNCEVCSC